MDNTGNSSTTGGARIASNVGNTRADPTRTSDPNARRDNPTDNVPLPARQ
jgi:hypothetical protein